MAIDITRQGTKGGDPQYDTSNLRGVREERGVVTGIVKANVHGSHMGVIKVWIPNFSTDETDKSQWRTVRYCTPYYSRADNNGPLNTYLSTKVPSGFVTPPPDIGTTVLCFFADGKNAEGYYFACVPDTFMLQTVPEATRSSDGTPAGEFNDNPTGVRSAKTVDNFKKEPRPTDFYTQTYLQQQGLLDDAVRGINNSGYMRESPSELIGISSKGRRITEQGADFLTTYNAQVKNPDTADKKVVDGLLGPYARRKGHSITLDDGDIDGNSNQIRLRTSTGHQILLNDSEGIIYVGNSTGNVWIELTDKGTMDVYAIDSINFRSKNINFHADGNIKFHSKGYTQIVSEQQLALEGKAELTAFSEGEIGINGKKNLHLHTDSELFATSTGASYYNAGGNISVAGSLVLLQGPKTQAKQAKKINATQKEDTTYDPEQRKFVLDEEQLLTTTADRITMHEPFLYHNIITAGTPYSGGLSGASGSPTGGYSIVPQAVAAPTAISDPTGGLGPGGAGGVAGVSSSISGAVSSSPVSAASFGGATSALQGADFGSFTKDISGKITGLSSELQAKLPGAVAEFQNKLPGAVAEFNKVLPQAQDQLKTVLNSPAINKFPITDMVKQVNTGFSVGALDSIDTTALNAAVVKQAGSLNNPQFVDSITKSVGKFGVNVDQLKKQGFVRPEAVFNDQLADPSIWTGKAGATSLNKFLGNEGLQESVQQAVTADEYQTMVNSGAIKLTDSKEEIIGMLTASNAASPEVVKQVREGFSNIEGVLQNTTNIPSGEDVASVVKQNMQTGAAAARRAEQIKADQVATTKPATTLTTTTTTPTSTETTTTTVTGGDSTTVTEPTVTGKITTGTAYDPYAVYGPNAGKAKQYDDLIAQLETEQFEGYLSGNAVDLRDSIKELYALKDALRVE
jgi:hypothetical protein